MQLVIMIIHDSDHMNSILVKMMEAGIKGGSLIDCEGALQAIGRASSDPPPVFGSLRPIPALCFVCRCCRTRD